MIKDGNMGEATTELRQKLVHIQLEEKEDSYGWIYPV